MDTIRIQSDISRILSVFTLLGWWRNEGVHVFRIQHLIFVIFHAFFPISLVIGAFINDDWNGSLYLMVLAIPTSVSVVRLFYILWNNNQIHECLQELCVHFLPGYELLTQVEMKLNNFMKFARCFVCMCFAGFTFLTILIPIFSSETNLAFKIYFPINVKKSQFAFWTACAFTTVETLIWLCVAIFTINIWYVMLNCSIKYEILGYQFRNMCEINATKTAVKKENLSEAEKQKLTLEQFIEIIKFHQQIREKIDRFKFCFADMFFVQIATGGLGICTSVYILAFSDHANLIKSAFYVITLLYNSFDIFMVMFLGNEIKLTSSRLAYCLFQSNWIEQSHSCKTSIIIFGEMLRQPHELMIGIGKMYPLNFETFTTILNFAYRSFNVLKEF